MLGNRERPHRLSPHRYVGPITVAYTLCVAGRRHLFTTAETVEVFRAKLFDHATRNGCLVSVYCFMPDHLHLILFGLADNADSLKAVRGFKVATGIWLARSVPGIRWQQDFYDHIIRKEEDWRAQAAYVLHNPVRAGLTDDPFRYPFSGTQAAGWDDVFR